LALVIGAGVLRIAMALGLWMLAVMISNNPPLEVMAFRLKAIDALGYNQEALHILAYWNGIRDQYLETLTFSLVVAVLYKIFGPHPLVISIFNSICYACVGLLAYGITKEFGRHRWESRTLALAICFWPVSLVWSIAPLKEGPILLAIFGFLYCFLRILSGQRLSLLNWLALGLGLLISLFSVVFLRFYMWYLFWAMFPALFLHQILPPGQDRTRPGWQRMIIAALLIMVGLGLSQPFNQESIVHINPVNQSSSLFKTQDGLFAYNLVDTAYASSNGSAESAKPPSASQAIEPPGILQKLAGKLSFIRRSSVRLGGSSLSPEARQGEDSVDITKDFQTWQGVFRSSLSLLKGGFRDLFLFPYPWEPWPEGRGWGPVQLAVAAQSLFWYLILPGLAAGIIIGLHRRPAATITLCLWGLTLGIMLAITTLNRGTLFRLREMALMPLLLLWHPWPYLRLWRLFRKKGSAN